MTDLTVLALTVLLVAPAAFKLEKCLKAVVEGYTRMNYKVM